MVKIYLNPNYLNSSLNIFPNEFHVSSINIQRPPKITTAVYEVHKMQTQLCILAETRCLDIPNLGPDQMTSEHTSKSAPDTSSQENPGHKRKQTNQDCGNVPCFQRGTEM